VVRVAVLASGRGSNMQALLARLDPTLAQVVLLVANRADAGALALAAKAGVRAEYIAWPKNGRAGFEAALCQLLLAEQIDLICLAGFMRLLSPQFTANWAGKILNIHPSLLPNFPGLQAQAQALAAGVSESGCTVHLVDAGLDSGPIILQTKVPVLATDSEASLAARILVAEHQSYAQAVHLLLAGTRNALAAAQEPA
jgi:phosphoribosylglycinamide formyltransferase 1